MRPTLCGVRRLAMAASPAGPGRYRSGETVRMASRLCTSSATPQTFSQTSVPGVGASVTRSRGCTAAINSRSIAGSRRGLSASTRPAVSPPQITQCVSGRLGRTIGHRVAAAEAVAAQQVGRLRDARDPLAVRPHEGLLEIVRLQKERQRGRFGVPLGTALQQCIGAAAVGERLGEFRLEGAHVLRAAHGRAPAQFVRCSGFHGGILV